MVIPQATLNVLIGAGIALAGTGIYNWNIRRIERYNLRRALILEIVLAGSSIQFLINNNGVLPNENIDPSTYFPSMIYEANIDQIKTLNKNEIEAVFQYYVGIYRLRSEVSPHEPADPEFVLHIKDEGLRTLEELRRGPIYRMLRRLRLLGSDDAYES